MKKLLLGIVFCVFAGTGFYFTARGWFCQQALRAIEAATEAKAEAESVEMELFSGRLHLQRVTLTARSTNSFWEKLKLERISGQIQWSAWSSGKIPMAVKLENGVLSLRSTAPVKWVSEPFRIPVASPLSSPGGPSSTASMNNRRVVLSKIEAQNISAIESRTQLPLAAGISGVAQRALAGWRGQLTATSIGPEALPLTQVRFDFSTETAGTRLAQLRCNLKEGRLSGDGWYSDEGVASLELKVEALPLTALTAWAHGWGLTGLEGRIFGEFRYQGDAFQWAQSAASGSFAMENSTLKLPATVVSLLALAGSKTDALSLDTLSGKFSRTPEQWALSDLTLHQQNHLAIMGGLQSVPDTEGRKNRVKAELRIGIAKAWLASLGLAGLGEIFSGGSAGNNTTNRSSVNAATATAPSTADFQWIALNMEASPEQLWQQFLTSLSGLLTASDASNPSTPNGQPSRPSLPQQLQQKAKGAVDTMLNLLAP